MTVALARRRAAIVVAAVVGYQQLVAGGWEPSDDAEPRALIETLFAIVTSGAREPEPYPKRPET